MKEWKDIRGYEGIYEISNTGLVRRAMESEAHDGTYPGRQLKLDESKGYLRAPLTSNGRTQKYMVHRLVASMFLSNPLDFKQVNHKNGIKTDNRVENLEWCTPGHNSRHAWDMGLCYTRGANMWKAKLTDEAVVEIRRLAKSGVKTSDLAEVFDITTSNVRIIVRGATWKHLPL